MKITKTRLKEIIKEEIIKEAAGPGGVAIGAETGGWARDPENDYESEEEIIGDEPAESAQELSATIDSVIVHLRALEERMPELRAITGELVKVQQELDRQAAEAANMEEQ